MKLYHRIMYAPRVAKLGGHTGITVFSWTFCAEREVSPHFARHEYCHVLQWYWCTAAAASIVSVSHALFGWSLWWLLASPLGFLLPYWASVIVQGYAGSVFERDAERYAGERDQ